MFGTMQFIPLETAQKIMAAAEAEARSNGWNVAVAIVDAGMNLLMFQKMDGVQTASIDVAIGKARTAAGFKRSTKALEDLIAGGRTAFVAVDGVVPVQGGLPIRAGDAVLGAIGVSGLTSAQDEQVAEAALTVLEPSQPPDGKPRKLWEALLKAPSHTLTVKDAQKAVGTTSRYYGQIRLREWVQKRGGTLVCAHRRVTLNMPACHQPCE